MEYVSYSFLCCCINKIIFSVLYFKSLMNYCDIQYCVDTSAKYLDGLVNVKGALYRGTNINKMFFLNLMMQTCTLQSQL